jgi:hypothetical protein
MFVVINITQQIKNVIFTTNENLATYESSVFSFLLTCSYEIEKRNGIGLNRRLIKAKNRGS